MGPGIASPSSVAVINEVIFDFWNFSNSRSRERLETQCRHPSSPRGYEPTTAGSMCPDESGTWDDIRVRRASAELRNMVILVCIYCFDINSTDDKYCLLNDVDNAFHYKRNGCCIRNNNNNNNVIAQK